MALAGGAAIRPAFSAGKVMDEYDPANIKISHRMTIRSMSDDDLLFLKQLGVRWARIEFGEEASFDYMRATQQRLDKFGMKIFNNVLNAPTRNVQDFPTRKTTRTGGVAISASR